ncbi:hypothetical protein VMCG_02170 [Cytospora schulzeri]|uniref:Actin-like ATPase domain-containing protein n=1 Tax=Cytospora schulzeri TaxID=448051 RepID=A0A423X116_9PEZI|nr:hypothetical protein VMCG_02170 [Valsa malicola]
MDPPQGAHEEVERYDNYHDPSEYKPKTNRKRSAGLTSGAPAAKKRAAAAKTPQTGPKAKPVKPVKPATIVVSIDFGTTFTGFTYAYSGDAGNVQTITDWADGNSDDPKTPSAIKFSHGETTWGIEAKKVPEALQWFKLFLVDESDLPADVRGSTQLSEARDRLQTLGMTAVDVVASFLKLLWLHCLEKMKVAEGEDTVDTSRLHVVVTLPAIWQNDAQERMRQAVDRAGILNARRGVGKTTLDLVSEPEAAALAALSGVDGRHNVDDSFVIVDCGGGTVDLISYKVTKTNPMEVKEVVGGEGALCGAIFVDEQFEGLLRHKLRQISKDALDRIDSREIQEMMTVNWENGIRKAFTGADQVWTIRYPYSLLNQAQIQDARVFPTFTITSEDVREVFRPTMDRIQALVVRQINAYVILVGGFGRSKYMLEYLRPRCLDVEVLQRQGFEPWSAISRGAVIHGLTQQKVDSPFISKVRSRIARASYGVVCQVEWDEEKYDRHDYSVDDVTGFPVAGQDIEKGQFPRHELYQHLKEKCDTLVITTKIYISKAEEPPIRKDESVVELHQLTWKTKIDWESLPRCTSIHGKELRRLDYSVTMECVGGSGVLIHILHNGARRATKNMPVDVHENFNN